MKIYVVTLEEAYENFGDIFTGLWGTFSTMEKAVLATCKWIDNYHESFENIERHHNNTICVIKTNKSKWRIEESKLDEE